jgi:hypothetical protein
VRSPIAVLFWDTSPLRKLVVLAVLITASFSTGLATRPTRVLHVYHGVQVETPLPGEGVAQSMDYWRVEIARRFPDAYAVAVHGGDIGGQWLVQDPDDISQLISATKLAQRLQARFPGRIIVLLSCNPGHYNLGIRGVYHAMDSVWFVPDKDADNTQEGRQAERQDVGNIYEFNDN